MATAVKKQSDKSVCSANLLLCIKSRIPTQGMVTPTQEVGVPTSVKIINTISHMNDQRPISLLSSDTTKLTIQGNHHKD